MKNNNMHARRNETTILYSTMITIFGSSNTKFNSIIKIDYKILRMMQFVLQTTVRSRRGVAIITAKSIQFYLIPSSK